MSTYEISYTIPASEGTVEIEANSPEEATAKFEELGVVALFRDASDWEDPQIDEMVDLDAAEEDGDEADDDKAAELVTE